MSDEPDYRPRSPDLSAFAPPPPPPHLTRLPSYHDPGPPTGYPLNHRGSYDASPFFSPAIAQSATSYFGSQPHAEPHNYSPQNYQSQSQTPFSATFPPRYSLPSQRTPQSFSHSPIQVQRQSQPEPFAYPPPTFSQPHYDTSPSSTMARPRRRKSSADEDDSDDASYNPNSLAPGRTGRKRKSETIASDPALMSPATSSNPFQAVEVKTKFPVARIKRIMQADEDVGKVAQATPTAVSKALELFMIALVQKGATEASARNSKKVTAAHLKSALLQDQQFDFVWGICEKVADPSERKRGANAKSEGDDESGEGEPAVKKGKRRGTKVDDSD